MSSDETNETSASYAEETAEELLEQAQANAQAILMGTVRFLHRQKISIDDWAASLGETFALGWLDDDDAWEAGEFLDAMLTNLRSLGASVQSADLGAEVAKATITGFPDPEMAELLSIDRALTVRYLDAAKVIAAPRGIDWAWKRTGDRISITATRRVQP